LNKIKILKFNIFILDFKIDWHTDPDGVVKLLPVNSQTSVIFGLCSNEGNTQLKHNDHLSIKISVRPAETVKFLSTSVKYATNVPNVNTLNPNLNNGQKTATSLLTPMSNLVQFQTVNSFYSHNCSSSFEKYFHELNNNEVILKINFNLKIFFNQIK